MTGEMIPKYFPRGQESRIFQLCKHTIVTMGRFVWRNHQTTLSDPFPRERSNRERTAQGKVTREGAMCNDYEFHPNLMLNLSRMSTYAVIEVDE